MTLFAHGREIAAGAAKGRDPCITAEGASDLLLYFDHAQISLRLVVGERNGQIVQKRQHLI